jgi:hypothetical protein
LIHPVFDVTKWKAEYPLPRLREEARQFVLNRQKEEPDQYENKDAVARHIALMQPGGDIIEGPKEVAVIEQIRDEVRQSNRLEKRIPTDLLIFGEAEPSRPEVSKVGGAPYWPQEKPWPTKWPCPRRGPKSKEPRTFIAQICFADSHDLIGSTSNDVLVIFAAGEYLQDWNDDDTEALTFEWLPLGLSDLVTIESVPKRGTISPRSRCAMLHRTVDYPSAGQAFDSFNCSWQLDVIEGTKIGGVPRWIQDEEPLEGRFLCSLGSDTIMWGDMGTLYLFTDKQNRISWTIQYY